MRHVKDTPGAGEMQSKLTIYKHLSTNISFELNFEAGISSHLSEIWGEFAP